jgi:hypothetical protein
MLDETQAKLDLLKVEIGILAGKAKDTVDNLWRIRVYTYTFWFACIGAGLAGLGFKDDKGIVWPLVWLSFVPPVVAAYVDATYHAWYRLLVLREAEIGRFINDEKYGLPCAAGPPNESRSFGERLSGFPVYDLNGYYTFGAEHKDWLWERSIVRSLASLTPLLVYASQLCGSAVIVFSFGHRRDYTRLIPACLVIIVMLALVVMWWSNCPRRRQGFHG